jgi:hypothetical protein
MKRIFNFLFRKRGDSARVESVEVDKGKCITCRFADYDKDQCRVGTYLAERGYSGFCYAGELWQSKD